MPLGLGERVGHVPPDQPREDVEQRPPDVLREGEVGREVALQMIVEDAADAAVAAPVRHEEIVVAPLRIAVPIVRPVRVARRLERRLELGGVGGDRQRRVEVGPAAEPALGRHEEARVHVDRRHVRVGHVGDKADAGGEEARVGFRAVDRLGEFGRELAEHGRGIDPDLLEHPPRHQPHDAAAAGRAGGVGAFPRRPHEAARRSGAGALVLDRLEGGAELVAERLEPRLGGELLVVEGGGVGHGGCLAERRAGAKTKDGNDRAETLGKCRSSFDKKH